MDKEYIFCFNENDNQNIKKRRMKEELFKMYYDIDVDGDRFVRCKEKTPNGINAKSSPESTSITIPEGIKHIEAEAFANCESITNIYLPQSLESIGTNAFSMCYNLSEIHIPKGVKYIGSCAFIVCKNLKKIVVDPQNISYCSVDGSRM